MKSTVVVKSLLTSYELTSKTMYRLLGEASTGVVKEIIDGLKAASEILEAVDSMLDAFNSKDKAAITQSVLELRKIAAKDR